MAEYAKIERTLEQLADYKFIAGDQFDAKFDEVANIVAERSSHPGCGLSAIELSRDGKVEISLNNLSEAEAQDVASQIFFFIRDVCHVHQHHAPTSDTILDVVPSSEGDTHWKRETLYSLFRWVIQQKRSRSPSAFVDAKGVLAYARAFAEKHCGAAEREIGLPQYLREATIESLDAGLARAEFEEKQKGKLSAAFFNRIIPVSALLLAFLSPFYRTPDAIGATDQEILVAKFADWLNAHIIDISASVVFVVFLANVGIIYRSRIFGGRAWFDFFRLLFSIPYHVVLLILLVTTGSLTVLGVQEYMNWTSLPFDPGP